MDRACIPSPTKCHLGGEDDSSDCTQIGLVSDADKVKSPSVLHPTVCSTRSGCELPLSLAAVHRACSRDQTP
jgi:hypothetical protein